jgi:hypothetical protein
MPKIRVCVPLISTVLLVLAMISMWVSFSILPDNFSSTDKDFDTSACLPSCKSNKLPGEEEFDVHGSDAFSYNLKPYYLGDRTCAWFDKDPARCRLPTTGDICFDLVTWKDSTGNGCEWWTKHINKIAQTDKTKLYSPRELGEDPKCHTAPPNNPTMTSAELQEMRRACCVCGAHRDERNYQGSLSTKHLGSLTPAMFSPVMPPPQHTGRTPTHLTQCCKCDSRSRGIEPVQDGKEDNIRKRGGTWTCKATRYGTKKDFIMGVPNETRENIEIAAICLSAASVCSLAVLLFIACSPENQDQAESNRGGSEDDSSEAGDKPERPSYALLEDAPRARFLLRL